NRFRRRQEREAFLRAMGFIADATDDDDGADGGHLGPRDFAALATSAAHFLHDPKRFAQTMEPHALPGVGNWLRAEPGLYNAALLMLGPRLRYARGLVRDLREIAGHFSDEDLDASALGQVFPHDQPTEEPNELNSDVSTTLMPEDVAHWRLLQGSQR